MPAKTVAFDDGSRITWKDRETLLYEEPGYAALLWVDYEPGFFSRGRILRAESLDRWHVCPKGSGECISPEKKAQITKRVQQYFGKVSVRSE